MPPLSKKAPRLLRIVDGKQHATSEHHDQDDETIEHDPVSSNSDNDNDTSDLGRKRIVTNRIHAPRAYTKPETTASPTKRPASPDDDLIFSQSQTSRPKRSIKTFGKTSVRAARQEKAASSFKPSTVGPAVNKPPETKKSGFKSRPPTDLSSSQPDTTPAPPVSRFRKLTPHHPPAILDSAEVSGQSQSLIPESSQLSPPPRLSSSPLSSLYEESDLDLDLIGKIVCPICGDKVESEFKDNFQTDFCRGRRMNMRLQEKFCQAHKARNALDIWQDRGYPKIDWSTLKDRCKAHHQHLRNVLDGTYDSPFRLQHAKMLNRAKGGTVASAAKSGNFTGLRAGYYGTKGEKLMAENIVNTFSDELRTLSTTDPLISAKGASGGMSGFVHAILVPEMALELITQDMDCDRDKAKVILADSADIGEMLNGEEDEKVPRVEVDLLDDVEDSGGGYERRSSDFVLVD